MAEACVAEEYSIADARSQFPKLIHRAERGKPVAITRRGRPVAVILSAADYERLTARAPSISEAIAEVRVQYDLQSLGLEADEFRDLRDRSTGREMAW